MLGSAHTELQHGHHFAGELVVAVQVQVGLLVQGLHRRALVGQHGEVADLGEVDGRPGGVQDAVLGRRRSGLAEVHRLRAQQAIDQAGLRGRGAAALRVADAGAHRQCVGEVELAVHVVERTGGLGALAVEVVELQAHHAAGVRGRLGDLGTGDHVARDHGVLDQVAGVVDQAEGQGVGRAVVIVGVELGAEGADIELDVGAGLELQAQVAARALAHALEHGRVQAAGDALARQVGVAGGRGLGHGDDVVAEDLLAVAAQVAVFLEGLGQEAEGVVVVLPGHQAAELRIGLAGQRGVRQAQRHLAADTLLEAQGLARQDVHAARDAALGDVGAAALVDDGLTNQL